jgi:anti-sigma-K factor RskA
MRPPALAKSDNFERRSPAANNPPLHWTAAAERLLSLDWSSARPRPVNGITLGLYRVTKSITIALAVVAVVAIALFLFLRQRAASAKYPIIYNVANFLDEGQLKQIESVVRSKGEKYLVSIAVVNVDKAQVTVGDGSFQPRSGRLYKMKRSAAGWEVGEVETWKNEP